MNGREHARQRACARGLKTHPPAPRGSAPARRPSPSVSLGPLALIAYISIRHLFMASSWRGLLQSCCGLSLTSVRSEVHNRVRDGTHTHPPRRQGVTRVRKDVHQHHPQGG